jgi:hypothetical protein
MIKGAADSCADADLGDNGRMQVRWLRLNLFEQLFEFL